MENIIAVKNYNKRIGSQVVLKDINMQLEKGKIYGLKGRNGSGKTMLLRAMCGLIFPDSGEVCIKGKPISIRDVIPPSIGAVIEAPGFILEYSGYRNLKLLASIKNTIDSKRIEEAMVMVGLDPHDKKRVKAYSLGMKQRLGIAQAIMEYPELVLLDEPTNALDTDGVEILRALLLDLKGKGVTVVIASHNQEDLNLLCDEVFLIEKGCITT